MRHLFPLILAILLLSCHANPDGESKSVPNANSSNASPSNDSTFSIGIDTNDLGKYSYLIETGYRYKKGVGHGTAFFIEYKNSIYLVTSYHNIFQYGQKITDLLICDHLIVYLNSSHYSAFQVDLYKVEILKNAECDIAILNVSYINRHYINAIKVNFHPINDFLLNKGTRVRMAGYPVSGGFDLGVKPRFVNGQTTKDFISKKTMMPEIFINMTAVSEEGASGSPVFGFYNSKADLLGVYHGGGLPESAGLFSNRYGIFYLLGGR